MPSELRHLHAALLVAAAAAIPRLVALAAERGEIFEEFVEKSDTFARTLVESGTFGFLPGVPSAYTQPLYAFFLAGLYWAVDDSWLVVGLAQTAVAVATAVLVLEIGRRLRSTGLGVVAALVATLHPYLVWHDVHVNREIVDGFLLAAIAFLALLAYEHRSIPFASATGALMGVAVLGNTRLALLPLVLAPYLVWRIRPRLDAFVGVLLVVVFAGIVVSPWVLRNEQQLGCYALTTDTRALWKANNVNTYDVLADGGWIDDVPELEGAPPWPEKAASISPEAARAVDECAQMRLYRREVIDFWQEEPEEKGRLAAQAVGMLWRPTFTTETSETAGGDVASFGRRVVEPAFMIPVFALALVGLGLAPPHFSALALILLVYNTLAATAFAGTVRYRAPFDFLLALLAAFTLVRLAGLGRRLYARSTRWSSAR